jgi:thiol-disulfide isomerase/thioredoxin
MPTDRQPRRTASIVAVTCALVGFLVACGPAAEAPPSPTATVEALPSDRPSPRITSPGSATTPVPAPAVTADPTVAAPVLDQAWANVELTNAADGSTFRIADFAGRTVFLENMAIWCGNCKEQQRAAAEAAQMLGDDVVYIVLDVEPTEDSAALAAYAARNDFPFIYAVAPKAYSRAIASEFGDLVLAPPTTPVWFIGADGTVTLTKRGAKSAEELVELARAHGAS